MGIAAIQLGAGRLKTADRIDPSVGIVLQRKVGEQVQDGDALAFLHANDETLIEKVSSDVLAAFRVQQQALTPRMPLIIDDIPG